MTAETPTAIGNPIVWHDAENGAYAADLAMWERIAAESPAPIVDIGAGTGRVSLHLARRGFDVIAIDNAPELLAALEFRAQQAGLAIRTVAADARELAATGIEAGVVIAPMQLAHLMGGAEGRRRLLRGAKALLPPGGRFHLVLLTESAEAELGDTSTPPPLPDVRERDGWVHSSLPTAVVFGPSGIEVHRRRELVSPSGELQTEDYVITLDYLTAGELEAEARDSGWIVGERTEIGVTADHVGSVVVSLETPR